MTDYDPQPRTPPMPGSSGASSVQRQDDRSIGDLLADVSRSLSTLLRQEIALAKAELKESAAQAGRGAAMFAGAAVAGLMFLAFLSVAAWWAIGTQTGRGWSGLIVAGIWLVIAIILALVGRSQLQHMKKGLPETQETLRKVPNAVKGHEEENR